MAFAPPALSVTPIRSLRQIRRDLWYVRLLPGSMAMAVGLGLPVQLPLECLSDYERRWRDATSYDEIIDPQPISGIDEI